MVNTISSDSGLTTVEVQASARLMSLLRLLLLVLAWAVLSVALRVGTGHLLDQEPVLRRIAVVLFAVAGVAAVLAVGSRYMRHSWQLMLHVLFDIGWISYLIYLSGGVVGPGVSLLYAVVLTSSLVLPGVLPFVVPSLAAIGLGVSGATYLAGILPAGISSEVPSPLVDPYRIISGMVAQVGALFLVDLLAQLLARRVHDQRILTSELLDQLGEGVLVVDRQERLLYANLEFWRLFNLEQRMFPGTTASDIFDRTHLREVLDVLRHGELPAWSRLTTPDQRHLTIRVGALIGRRGRRLGRTVTVVDETRLRHLEDDAARGARLAALGEMAAGIAHEVRNPLASLRGCAQELAGITCSTGQDDTRVLAGILTGEADRLGRIIDDFLALSRLRGPDMRPIHLPPLMQEIEAEIRHRDDLPASFEIECSCSADIGPIRGDVDQLRQILLNLCKNALDAIADGDGLRLGISARASHGEDEFLDRPAVTICIEDDGCGIAPESLEQVFTPFYSTKSRGTGLGLTLVQRMVHQHGGTMRIDSQPGQGTTVRLVMPRA